jgi:hypothetical protein
MTSGAFVWARVDLVTDGILTISEAAKRANMTEANFSENMQKFKA